MKQLELEKELRKELENMFQQSLCNFDKIKSNSKLLRFYTGFPNYKVFSIVLSFLGKDAASKLMYSNSELKERRQALEESNVSVVNARNCTAFATY